MKLALILPALLGISACQFKDCSAERKARDDCYTAYGLLLLQRVASGQTATTSTTRGGVTPFEVELLAGALLCDGLATGYCKDDSSDE